MTNDGISVFISKPDRMKPVMNMNLQEENKCYDQKKLYVNG
jgi:hypothetical protein